MKQFEEFEATLTGDDYRDEVAAIFRREAELADGVEDGVHMLVFAVATAVSRCELRRYHEWLSSQL